VITSGLESPKSYIIKELIIMLAWMLSATVSIGEISLNNSLPPILDGKSLKKSALLLVNNHRSVLGVKRRVDHTRVRDDPSLVTASSKTIFIEVGSENQAF